MYFNGIFPSTIISAKLKQTLLAQSSVLGVPSGTYPTTNFGEISWILCGVDVQGKDKMYVMTQYANATDYYFL